MGGRLLPRLVARGYRVRCLVRKPAYLRPRAPEGVELVAGDVLAPDTLPAAFAGVATAYYLVHSMGARGAFAAKDREGALNFARAARAAGVQRIIYLGGLAAEDGPLSTHLRSRLETGAALREAGVPVIELRASIVIGAGSLSFEMIRALVQKLPVMTAPRWVNVQAQPIAVDDLLLYLEACADLPGRGDAVYEIGGADVVTYADLMREYARQRGLHRWIIPVPVLTPWLSSLWLGLVTPLYARVGRKLVDSLRHPSVVKHPAARDVFPFHPVGVREAIARALAAEDHDYEQTRWSDSLAAGNTLRTWGGARFGSRLMDSRCVTLAMPAAQAFRPVARIGGRQGWYFGNALWRLRGWLDLLVGGVGMRRGRRHPEALRAGDVIDCWRVEQVEPGHRLRLVAEMKLPGRAWLEFEVTPTDAGHCVLQQTALFDPLGLGGLLYWYGIYPLHRLVFAGMLRGIARAAARD